MLFKFQKDLEHIFSILHDLSEDRIKIYLVGGFIRDYFLGKESKDLDFIIYPFFYKILEILSKAINGKIFPLDEERRYFRIIAKLNNENYILDFTPPERKDLLEELKRRDFTINSILFDLNNYRIMDPLGGIRDLKEGKLRVCSEYSISEDPLRILRAFRFVSNLGFKISSSTEKFLIENKKRLKKIKGERIHDEIYRILRSSFTKEVWIRMHQLGILEEVLPELTTLENIPWSDPHYTNPLFHSLEALGKFEYLYYYLNKLFPETYIVLEEYLKGEIYSEFTKKELLKFAILIHDIGKGETFSKDNNGKVHYYGHERAGVLMVENIAERLRFSRKEEDFIKKLIKYHLYPFFIFKDKKSNRSKILNKLKEETIGLILLFIADQFSITPSQELLYFSQEIFDLYLKRKEIKPLLSGEEIMKYFFLKPSSLIGKLKESLIQAQQEGIVKDKKEALEYLDNILKNEKPQ
ncbi:MAG: HD domain-containing protein [Dictyoglomaceae bacterium]|nr:HD domain-containing protein [Dictyoglomaceae bacterium]